MLAPDGTRPWLFTRYEDVRAVLGDPRFSADDQHPAYTHLLSYQPRPGDLSFLRLDPPRHTALRRMLTAEFTVRRTEAMRPMVRASPITCWTPSSSRAHPPTSSRRSPCRCRPW